MEQFVMASTESRSFNEPRACRFAGALRSESRDDLVLADIQPVVVGQGFGLGGRDIERVVLASRLEGRSLDDLETCWPVPVYVLLMDGSQSGRVEVRDEELRLIAWAELYPSEVEYGQHMRQGGST
jgi:hypothetical protein